MKSVIRVEHLSKAYRIGAAEKKSDTIAGALWNAIKSPVTNFKQLYNLRALGQDEATVFWALKDINFEVKEGEVLGIIGHNGAGKSTLLKILSRITEPTEGRVTIHGRVSSLLEVGTGFHPDLTGRENIYMNGTILGMRKKEIDAKLEEIIAFSGINKYIDTPVKRYSSGMTVRLAFSVAAHLDPEILIIDEVLAVGDVEFQKKCIGKMEEVSNAGRTVLFVSHNMASVQKLCTSGLILESGRKRHEGPILDIIERYLEIFTETAEYHFERPETDTGGWVKAVTIEDLNGELLPVIPVGQAWQVRITFRLNRDFESFIVALGINTKEDFPLRTIYSKAVWTKAGIYEAIFAQGDILYASGHYKLVIGISTYERAIHYIDKGLSLHISELMGEVDERIIRNKNVGYILNPADVSINVLD
ncbi:MAG: ATP-binding cassette domain-containing protein [Cyclobacteriaceae bacterium]|nr:ATP-binding cassette domain-containing protein [Cyclobacteriaceae bacterium]